MTESIAMASETEVSVAESEVVDEVESEAPSVASMDTGALNAAAVDNGALQEALEQAEERAPPPPAHSLKHELQHSQPVCILNLIVYKVSNVI